MEPGDGSKIDKGTRVHSVATLGEADLSTSSKSLSRSSSLSLSSSSSGSGGHFFVLGETATVQSSADATNTFKLDDENVLGPLEGKSHQASIDLSNPSIRLGGSSSSSSSSSESSCQEPSHLATSATFTSPGGATSFPKPNKDSTFTSQSSPQDTFGSGAHATNKSSVGATSILEHDQGVKIGPSEPDLSSSEPSHKGPLQTNTNATSKSPVGGTSNIPVSSMPKNEQSSNGLAGVPSPLEDSGHSRELSATEESATQSPPTQAMERTGDPASSPYRIPSHVFARTKSTAPVEWSSNSNESLFSIQMGNMSFTREQLYWLGKSGELVMQGEASGFLMDLPNNKSAELGQKMPALDEVPQFTELAAAATMREVIKESEDDRTKDSPSMTEGTSHSASPSAHSDGSTRSFAFPILTGEGDNSMKVGSSKKKWKSNPVGPQSQSQPQTPKESPNAAQNSKVDQYESPNGWLSYFSCCSMCSMGR